MWLHAVNYDLPNEIDSYVHINTLPQHTSILPNPFNVKPLVELLAESNQEVPSWLVKYAALQHKRPLDEL